MIQVLYDTKTEKLKKKCYAKSVILFRSKSGQAQSFKKNQFEKQNKDILTKIGQKPGKIPELPTFRPSLRLV